MPFPKLSPAFNNCSLHALTPEIMAEILFFASTPNYDNGYNSAYNFFKDCFAECYNLSKPLDWPSFAAILNQYNPFDLQIVLAHALRLFMKKNLDANVDDIQNLIHERALFENLSIKQFINSRTEVRETTAQYLSLEPFEIIAPVAKLLGLNIHIIRDEVITSDDTYKGFANILLFFTGQADDSNCKEAGGHWERSANALVESRDYSKDSQFSTILSLPSLCDYPVTQGSISLIKEHVNLVAEALKGNPPPDTAFLELNLTAQQIAVLAKNSIFGLDKKLLLQQLSPEATEATKKFYQTYNPLPSILDANEQSLLNEFFSDKQQKNNPSRYNQVRDAITTIQAKIPQNPLLLPPIKEKLEQLQIRALIAGIQNIRGNFANLNTRLAVEDHLLNMLMRLSAIPSLNPLIKTAIDEQTIELNTIATQRILVLDFLEKSPLKGLFDRFETFRLLNPKIDNFYNKMLRAKERFLLGSSLSNPAKQQFYQAQSNILAELDKISNQEEKILVKDWREFIEKELKLLPAVVLDEKIMPKPVVQPTNLIDDKKKAEILPSEEPKIPLLPPLAVPKPILPKPIVSNAPKPPKLPSLAPAPIPMEPLLPALPPQPKIPLGEEKLDPAFILQEKKRLLSRIQFTTFTNQFKIKRDNIKKFKRHHDAAKDFCLDIENAKVIFMQNPSLTQAKIEFQKNCFAAITKSSILLKHRRWIGILKAFFLNIANIFSPKKFELKLSYLAKTDSGKKFDDFAKKLQQSFTPTPGKPQIKTDLN